MSYELPEDPVTRGILTTLAAAILEDRDPSRGVGWLQRIQNDPGYIRHSAALLEAEALLPTVRGWMIRAGADALDLAANECTLHAKNPSAFRSWLKRRAEDFRAAAFTMMNETERRT